MKRSNKNRRLLFICLGLVAMLLLACGKRPTETPSPTPTEAPTATPEGTPTPTTRPEPVADNHEKAADAVKNMVIGWNLGNYFDATGGVKAQNREVSQYLTQWGNPIVGESLYKKLKDLGFKAVRIPITWNFHFDIATTELNADWLAEIKKNVDWALKYDMYVIINVHHDTGADGWIRASVSNYEKCQNRYAQIWKGIAEYFKDYPDKLIFEGFNEMLDEKSDWNNATADAGKAINLYNQLFVDTVRATGGNNSGRNLICNTYAAAHGQGVLDAYKVPEDTVKDHIIGQVHFYSPYEFVSDQGITWTKPIYEYTSYVEKTVDDTIKRIGNAFKKKGIPCIIGEFATEDHKNTEARVKWYSRVVADAKEFGIVCFVWDNGHKYNMGHIDRIGNEDDFPEIIDACVNAAK